MGKICIKAREKQGELVSRMMQVSTTPPLTPVLHLHLFPTTATAQCCCRSTLCMGAWRVRATKVPHTDHSHRLTSVLTPPPPPPQLPVVLCWSVHPLAWPGQPVLCSLKNCDFPRQKFPGDGCVHCTAPHLKEVNFEKCEKPSSGEKFAPIPGELLCLLCSSKIPGEPERENKNPLSAWSAFIHTVWMR